MGRASAGDLCTNRTDGRPALSVRRRHRQPPGRAGRRGACRAAGLAGGGRRHSARRFRQAPCRTGARDREIRRRQGGLTHAGPSAPGVILGLNGAPQAGEKFKVYEDEAEAKDIAYRRAQILREQGIRTKKHITLDEIGRRLALGNFKELNVIIKGDVDGSVEALSDSLQKLSTE